MPQRETCEVSASGSDQVKPNDLDAGLTVEGLSLKESRRPEGVADEEYTVEELMMSEDSLEDCNLYRYGGYHPVHLGDSLGDDARYRVLHKIGSGLSSTVWLCRDTVEGKYVALKIIMADKSKDSPELNSLKLKDVRHEESGGDKIAIPEDHFWTEGPNGTHLCLVLPVLGPRVPDILALANNPLRFSKSAAIQVVEGLEFLHRKGICHGDFQPANILLKVSNFDELIEEQLMDTFGKPLKVPVRTASGERLSAGVPDYLVRQINFWRMDRQSITDQICIVDFGESYEISHPPKTTATPVDYAAPEVIFEEPAGAASDIWALGCTLCTIRSGQPLFGTLSGKEDEVISSIIQTLGMLPKPWLDRWKGRHDPDPELMSNEDGFPATKFRCLKDCLGTKSLCIDPTTRESKIITIPNGELQIFVDLIGQMFTYDPKDRISIATIKAHSWFSGKWAKDKKEGISPEKENKQ